MNGNFVELGSNGEVFEDLFDIDFMPVCFS